MLKRHPAVHDCLVVGVPCEKFGQRVTAVISASRPISSEEVISHARKHLAGYKLPKEVIRVATVQRAPNGKADYPWAKAVATDQTPASRRPLQPALAAAG